MSRVWREFVYYFRDDAFGKREASVSRRIANDTRGHSREPDAFFGYNNDIRFAFKYSQESNLPRDYSARIFVTLILAN